MVSAANTNKGRTSAKKAKTSSRRSKPVRRAAASTKKVRVTTNKSNKSSPKSTRRKVVAKSTPTRTLSTPLEKRRIPSWIFVVGIFMGLSLMVCGGVYLLYRQTILSFQVAPTVVVQSQFRPAQPTSIAINDVGITLPITPADIINGIWQTSDTTATHLSTSARPSEPGNIVIYGHNFPQIFRKLHEVELDDVITITNADGQTRDYTVESIHVVKPSEIELVLPTQNEILTVYTCTGFLDTMRLVVQAKPV